MVNVEEETTIIQAWPNIGQTIAHYPLTPNKETLETKSRALYSDGRHLWSNV